VGNLLVRALLRGTVAAATAAAVYIYIYVVFIFICCYCSISCSAWRGDVSVRRWRVGGWEGVILFLFPSEARG